MIRRYIQLLIFVLPLLPGTTLAREWSSYSSENFTIYSDDRPKRIIKMLKEFETFRQVTFVVLGLPGTLVPEETPTAGP